jgi:hypothetical protein
MTPDRRLLSSTLGFAAVFALATGAGSGLLAQRQSQAVVTPDDPIWAQDGPTPTPQDPPQEAAECRGAASRTAPAAATRTRRPW